MLEGPKKSRHPDSDLNPSAGLPFSLPSCPEDCTLSRLPANGHVVNKLFKRPLPVITIEMPFAQLVTIKTKVRGKKF